MILLLSPTKCYCLNVTSSDLDILAASQDRDDRIKSQAEWYLLALLVL